MIELTAAFASGLLGSGHCVGMCGPWAAALGGNSAWRANLVRQLAYSTGRVGTYSALGAVAGYGGWRLTKEFPAFAAVPALLAIAAGLLMTWEGLKAAGVIRRPIAGRPVGCLASTFFAGTLDQRTLWGALAAGTVTSLLPCGLLYAMLGLAAAAHHPAAAALIMALFGLGTVPAMLLAGLSTAVLTLPARRMMFRAAAWCLVAAGVVSLARGGWALGHLSGPSSAACPACAAGESKKGSGVFFIHGARLPR
jgi:hypothetical protein